ncbi:hypothetical protein [Nocardioides currus]|uniref:hypothetical protein n=1 Tax=Nocardioides currus TaxID=2133958 RepID=UPI001057270E|nr:hypothetical protein [Nocardioides currus]
MLASSRTPPRRRRLATAGLAIGVLLVAVTGCSGDDDPATPTAPAAAEPTPLADYDTSGLALVRGDFCERVPADAVAAALDGEATDAASWRPGVRLPGTRDISNEFGCSWTDGSATARAWVFAPPITASRASDFVSETVGKGCRRLRSAPDLGSPSVAQQCDDSTGFHGLVGDAWVGCEVSAAATDEDLVGEWCVAVLEALRTS